MLSAVLRKFLHVPDSHSVASDTEVFQLLSHKQDDDDCNFEHAKLPFSSNSNNKQHTAVKQLSETCFCQRKATSNVIGTWSRLSVT